MKAARYVAEDPRLFAVYISNFSCGPDSFLLQYFDHALGDKPFLQIEIDEHSADAGAITRCEAFLDTLVNYRPSGEAEAARPLFEIGLKNISNHRKIYLPHMTPQARAVEAAMRSVGLDAVIMDEPNDESLQLGRRYTSGKECYPALLTTGDMLRQARRPGFDPKQSAFFMAAANGPCRFGQYNRLHRMILNEVGLDEVPLYVVDQDETFGQDIKFVGGREFEQQAWLGICAIDAFERMKFATRPYEVNRGDTDHWFEQSIRTVFKEIEARRPIEPVLATIRQAYEAIESRDRGTRPVIGVVGEIYVRSNRFANDNLFDQIEALGGEIAVPSIAEWLHYSGAMRSRRQRWRREYGAWAFNTLRSRWMLSAERRIWNLLGREADPPVDTLLELAEPYLDPAFEGESILTLGKSIEMIREHNAAGITPDSSHSDESYAFGIVLIRNSPVRRRPTQ
jgi:predicted nucleotide-binding protein (sugar kinase/HSP70/actin superfamily)